MSLAIGLGGFMDGFTGGMRARDAMDERKRTKVLQERHDVEYNRSLEQRNAVDQINKDARSTFDAQVTAGTQKPDNFMDWYHKYTVPKLQQTYLMNDGRKSAPEVQEWANTHEAQAGAKLFRSSITKAQTGDFIGALDDAVKIADLRGYANTGMKGMRYEPIVRTEGGPTIGMRIYATGADGKEQYSDVPNEKIPEVIARFANPEAAWESQRVARAVAEKEAADLRRYEEKKKIDRTYGVGEDKFRTEAIKQLRDEMNGGITGDEPKFVNLPRAQQEELAQERMSLLRGDEQQGITEPKSAPRPEKKVLVDTVTGKQVQPAVQKPTSPAPSKQNTKAATPEHSARPPIPGVPARAQEGVRRRMDELKNSSAAPGVAAPSQDQAVSKANEAAVPEWQWPSPVQEALRARQQSYGLNP